MRHDSAHLAVLFLLADRIALVVVLFSARDADFDLGATLFEINRQGNDRGALQLRRIFEFLDFPTMREKLPRTRGLMVIHKRGFDIRIDVALKEPELPALDRGVGFL